MRGTLELKLLPFIYIRCSPGTFNQASYKSISLKQQKQNKETIPRKSNPSLKQLDYTFVVIQMLYVFCVLIYTNWPFAHTLCESMNIFSQNPPFLPFCLPNLLSFVIFSFFCCGVFVSWWMPVLFSQNIKHVEYFISYFPFAAWFVLFKCFPDFIRQNF